MDLQALAVAILGAVAGPAASIKVASIQAGRALDDITKRLTALERSEPEAVAKLNEDLGALAKDLATVRGAVERLTIAHDKLVADEEKRRDKAAERAERRELREREQETALAAKLATVHTLLETLRQEIRDARLPR